MPNPTPNPTPTSEITNTQPRHKQCRHVHATGSRCGSPCLRGEGFCYYHHTGRPRVSRADREAIAAGYPIQLPFQLPLVEDRSSIVLALNQILQGIFTKQIDSKQSGQALYALQVACSALLREPRQTRSPSNRDDSPRHRSSSRNRQTLDGRNPYAQNSYDQNSYDQNSHDGTQSPPDLYVEELVLDPILGLVAPIADLPDPEPQPARQPNLVEDLLEKLLQENKEYYQEQKRQYEQKYEQALREATQSSTPTAPRPSDTNPVYPGPESAAGNSEDRNPDTPAVLPHIPCYRAKRVILSEGAHSLIVSAAVEGPR